ncbi:hypothetical protein GJ496_009443 [Pomphorhynchus laevis]|nr:hypothetical protein GJ496_009443 [Pomphorhynchus laevis]
MKEFDVIVITETFACGPLSLPGFYIFEKYAIQMNRGRPIGGSDYCIRVISPKIRIIGCYYGPTTSLDVIVKDLRETLDRLPVDVPVVIADAIPVDIEATSIGPWIKWCYSQPSKLRFGAAKSLTSACRVASGRSCGLPAIVPLCFRSTNSIPNEKCRSSKHRTFLFVAKAYVLPVKLGGLGIDDPSDETTKRDDNYVKLCEPFYKNLGPEKTRNEQ